MTYQNFINQTIEQIKPQFSNDTGIKVENITKNNGINLKALVISEPNLNIYPTIYLESFYQRAAIGEDISSLSSEILDVYYQHRPDKEIDISMFSDFERLKPRVVFRLVNKERNTEFLEKIPWIPYLDLAIIFCIYLDCPNEIYAGSIIHNSHMETWNTSVNELMSLATENTPVLLSPVTRSLPEFLTELTGKDFSCGEEDVFPIFVLTNTEKTHGAACILYQNLISEFANRYKKDIYIIPSSIHELMLMPDTGNINPKDIKALIREVNSTQVAEDEYLSDTLYKYNYSTKELEF